MQTIVLRFPREYPRQFWLLFCGLLISTVGASMIWPFLMIYVSERLALPLTIVASLMTVNAFMGLVFSFFAGPIIDFVGRKWVMVISLLINGLVYVFLSRADTLLHFVILMGISGAFNPLYRVGADAMMADLIPAQKRVDAYSLLRMSSNVGVAIGPAVGGVLATVSYSLAFYFAAGGMITYSLLIASLARETIPSRISSGRVIYELIMGYAHILRDRQFMPFIGAFTLNQMSAAIMWVLLAVYTKQQYQIPENLYGLIPATNALMVVFLQIAVTRKVKPYPPLLVVSSGTLVYAVGVGSVALGQGFWAFWLSMVIFTVGELILTPTATAIAANLAPADMRGRYMSLYGLTWAVAAGIGPILGGLLNDQVAPGAIWVGGGMIGLVSAVLFMWMALSSSRTTGKTASHLP
jgi:MFS family permease